MLAEPSIKLVLRLKNAKEQVGRICVRIGVSGDEYRFPATGYKADRNFWDDTNEIVIKGYPDHAHINTQISKIRDDYKRRIRLLEDEVTLMDVDDVIAEKKNARRVKKGSFIAFWREHIAELSKEDKDGNMRVAKSYVNQLNSKLNAFIYFTGEYVTYKDITALYLQKYYEHRLQYENMNTSINTTFKRVKEVVDKAVKLGYIDPRRIATFDWPNYIKPDRMPLTLGETEQIMELVFTGALDAFPNELKTAVYFLIECYAAIRFSDWARFRVEKMIEIEKLRVKAKKNKKEIHAHLANSPRLKKLLDYVKAHNLDFDLTERETNAALTIIRKKAGIKKTITTHIGRHTCATLMSEMGYSDKGIADLLGVSEQTARLYIHKSPEQYSNEYNKHGGL